MCCIYSHSVTLSLSLTHTHTHTQCCDQDAADVFLFLNTCTETHVNASTHTQVIIRQPVQLYVGVKLYNCHCLPSVGSFTRGKPPNNPLWIHQLDIINTFIHVLRNPVVWQEQPRVTLELCQGVVGGFPQFIYKTQTLTLQKKWALPFHQPFPLLTLHVNYTVHQEWEWSNRLWKRCDSGCRGRGCLSIVKSGVLTTRHLIKTSALEP